MIHNDKLKPVRRKANEASPATDERDTDTNSTSGESTGDWTSSGASSVHNDYSTSEESDSEDEVNEPNSERRYPVRQRKAREIPGAIPWDALSY